MSSDIIYNQVLVQKAETSVSHRSKRYLSEHVLFMIATKLNENK